MGRSKAAKKGRKNREKKAATGKRGGSRQQAGQQGAGSSATACAAQDTAAPTKQALTLPADECAFIAERVTVNVPTKVRRGTQKSAQERALVEKCCAILERYHMCIITNALSAEDLAAIYSEYEELLDFSGHSAIGEKDASKRSGTRFYNCKCQLGPKCGFTGWRCGAATSRHILKRNLNQFKGIWQNVVRSYGFTHCARVEVVTSHKGCRNQGWHVDGQHGITVIFPLVDVDLRKGPTQLDFTIPFFALQEGAGKIKHRDPAAPESARAAMPAGSVLLFNANCSHRGTANLSTSDRPILVLDTSKPCPQESQSIWDIPVEQ